MDGCNELMSTDPFDIRRIMVGFEGRPYPFGSAGYIFPVSPNSGGEAVRR